jgi:hypothetical protein
VDILARYKSGKEYERARRLATLSLAAAAEPESAVSVGYVYVDGHDVHAEHPYLLTQTKLLWGPKLRRPGDDPQIDGFAFKDARSYHLGAEPSYRNGVPSVQEIVVNLPDRRLMLSFLPSGVAGPQLYPTIDSLTIYVASLLKGYGASHE